ncbi:hypothetical protein KC332_g12879 [Hortaea werneckii]|nr:hypothetical protein KC358_g15069 [Hortaea werneckii]KAI6806631.1 hypothetical protein KC350_g14073 [Hortaea werneckii]KAI6910392.1 hypothetical protein KC348_g13224 [Hortaea werneckii]KAI6926778.1 hypothetical protein KC341_g12565 [Hortaea werneckii]KAI6960014.1 hypothetical protein KC321_g13089 [Hortaea werneckii]
MASSQPPQDVQCSSSSATQQTFGSETTQKDSLTQPPSTYLPPASHYTYRSSSKIYNRKLTSHSRNGVVKRYAGTQPKGRPTHIDPAKLSKAPMVRATIDPPARDCQPSGQRTIQADGDGHAVEGKGSRHKKTGILTVPPSAQSAPQHPTQQEQESGNLPPMFPLVLPVLDPSLLTSPTPLAGGKSISVFANEVAGLNPSVLSPMLMARMPFGGCVEVAYQYPKENTREME